MRITDIEIDGFGIWSNLSIEQLPEGAIVFYGENEAGKSTLMQFLRTAMYGFSEERRERYLPPYYGGRGGGLLRIAAPQGSYTLRRADHGGVEQRGSLEIVAEGGGVEGETLLGVLMAGVDEPTFNNVFAVGLREMQELATLDDTAAAEQLYNLTSGLDRVSLVDVMRQLKTSRELLLSSEGDPSHIAGLLDRRIQLEREINSLAAQGRRWAQLAAQRDTLAREAERQVLDIDHCEAQTRLVETALAVRDNWRARERAQEELQRIGPLPDMSNLTVARLEQINAELGEKRRRYEEIKADRAEIKNAAGELPLNDALWSQAARVEAYREQAEWATTLEEQIHKLEEEIRTGKQELREAYDRAGIDEQSRAALEAEYSRRTLAVLRAPARSLRSEEKKLQSAQEGKQNSREEADRLAKEINEYLADLEEKNLPQAIDKYGHLTTMLRKRVQVEDRLEGLTGSRGDLEEDVHDALDNEIMPINVLLRIGVVFMVGLTLLMGGFVFSPLFIGWFSEGGVLLSCATGVVVFAIGLMMKYNYESAVIEHSESTNSRLDSVSAEIEDAKDERDELDEQLPPGNGSFAARLEEAQEILETLESLLPLENKRKELLTKSDTAKQRVESAGSGIKEAQSKWRDSLKAAGLPEDMTPSRLQELIDTCELVGDLQRRLDTRQEDLQHRQKEWVSFAGRIEQLLLDAGLECKSQRIQDRIALLHKVLEAEKQVRSKRSVLADKFRSSRREQAKLARVIDKLERTCEAMFASSGAEDEREFRLRSQKYDRTVTLEQEIRELSRDIAHMLAGKATEEAIATELNKFDGEALEAHQLENQGKLDTARRKLNDLHEQRGKAVQEMKQLAEDRRLIKARLELESLEKQLSDATGRWRVLAVTSLILESIRQIYEKERQPETLEHASRYFEQLTDGKYTRVWTPLGGDGLHVDDSKGHSLPLEVLSCGTREAVFLSLRMALAAAFSRRGANLPLVLDDVLVNFDRVRAEAAARVLRAFAAEGHQILVFTCHEHIQRMFRELNVECRTMPHHADTAAGLSVSPTIIDDEEPAEQEPLEAHEVYEEPEYEEPYYEEVAQEPEVEEEPDWEQPIPAIEDHSEYKLEQADPTVDDAEEEYAHELLHQYEEEIAEQEEFELEPEPVVEQAVEEEPVAEEPEEEEPEEEYDEAEEEFEEEPVEEVAQQRVLETVPPEPPRSPVISMKKPEQPLNLTWDLPEVWFENAEELQKKVSGEEAA